MNPAHALHRLHDHQAAALAIIDETEALLSDPQARDIAALARVRWTLMRVLTAYMLFKHREIFDPAIAGTVLGSVQRADRMKAACLALGDEFRRYVQRWSATDVAGRWADYRPATLSIMARIRSHIAHERREIAALLETV